MANGLLKFDAGHHALVALLVLKSTLVLRIAVMLVLLKIQGQVRQGAKIIPSYAAYLADIGIDLAAPQHLQPTFHCVKL